MMKKILLLLIFSAAVTLCGAPSPIGLGGAVVLPGAGVRFRAFRDMKPAPMPMPAIRAFRESDNAKLMLDYECWRFRQTAGIWQGDSNRITIALLTLKPIGTPALKTEQEIEKEFSVTPHKFDEAEIKNWVELFTLRKVLSEKPFDGLFGCRAQVFELQEQPGVRQYAYLLTPSNDTDRRIFFLYEVDDGIPRERAEKTVRQSLGSVEFSMPKSDAGARKLSSGGGLQTSLSGKHSPEYIASRDRVIDSIKNFRDWWYLDTDNYIFVSNQDDRRSMLRLRRDLERAREVFAIYFPLEIPLKSVSVVRIFNTRDEYKEYIGADMQWSGGLWDPGRRELVISPLDQRAPESLQQQIMRQVAFHEGFHQYLYFASDEARPGMWFNEGTAQFFEGIDFRGGKASIGLAAHDERKLRKLFDGNQVYDIAALVNMDRETFYGSNRDTNYPLSQALVYYLFKSENPQYAKIPLKYYETLTETKDQQKANAAAWEGVDLKKFSEQLSGFWSDDKLIKRSIRYNPPASPVKKKLRPPVDTAGKK